MLTTVLACLPVATEHLIVTFETVSLAAYHTVLAACIWPQLCRLGILCIFQDFDELLTYIEEAIEENVERLSECGSDKMFQNLSAVFRSLFRLLSHSQTISQAEEMVRTVSSSAWSAMAYKRVLSCHAKCTIQCTTQTEIMDV